MKTGFFAIGLAEWRQACELGLNPAVAFLVLACGTGRDNQTSKWSATAVYKYSGIRWERGGQAIEQLLNAGLLTLAEGSTKKFPRYKLKISEDRIWLPKSIVESVAEEKPAIHRLRETQDAMLLRLFVELYHAQNLAADGGISRAVYCRKYTKEIVRDFGSIVYLGFEKDERLWLTPGNPVVAPHLELDGADRFKTFGKRMRTLMEMGFVQEASYLFESESDDAEILFPLSGPEPEETGLYALANEVVETSVAGGSALLDNYSYIVPVYRHMEAAALYGIFRMRFRAHTSNTGAWYASIKDKSDSARNMFRMATL
jgi:hypothetical protein